LLSQVGWHLKGDRIIKDGVPLSFEILISSKIYEKLVLHLKSVLQPLGINVSVRMIDRVVYEEKLDQLDFDMVLEAIPQSLLPGNEQMSYWGTSSANQPGTMNYAGISHPAVDALCEQLLTAQTYEKLCTYAHALDRVLVSQQYIIPGWHFGYVLVAHKPRIKWGTPPPHQVARWLFETMWVEEEEALATKNLPVAKEATLWQRITAWWNN